VTGATATVRPSGDLAASAGRVLRRNTWTIGLVGLLIAFLVFTRMLAPNYGLANLQSLAISALPLALAAVAQAIVVIAGGIDLSIGSMMAFTSVTAAVAMQDQSEEVGVLVAVAVLALGLVIGAVNGILVVGTRVPDIVVTLAMLFVWAGAALLVLDRPGGDASDWLMGLISGPVLELAWLPRALVVLIVLVAIVWIPVSRSSLGVSLYAIGSNRLAAYRSGVAVNRTKIASYVLAGFFAAAGGLALTASTGGAQPIPGPYTVQSVAAIVLGGVSLAGGKGNLLGPILAVYILSLLRTDLTFIGVNPSLSTALQGAILVGVVMFGAALTFRRKHA
jgi:ribose transport system permease protein